MKYVIVLGDGMADEPIEAAGGKTPLQLADKPVMDEMAKVSEQGIAYTVPSNLPAGSDVANLSMLGYDPQVYYSGRSPLEALSIGVDMKDTDIALRCNVVTVSEDEDYEDKTIIDHSAGEITSEEAAILIEAVRKELEDDEYKFLKYNNLSWKLRSVSSSNDPVISFRYLAMKGIVLPSSISLIVVSTCPRLIPSSSCKILIISISSPYKSTSIVCPFGTNWRYLTPAISNIFFDAFVVSLPAYLSCI